MPVVHGRDVLVKMATGAGKSSCIYLVPLAVGTTAVGVVISPFNGLMDQQVSSMPLDHQLVMTTAFYVNIGKAIK